MSYTERKQKKSAVSVSGEISLYNVLLVEDNTQVANVIFDYFENSSFTLDFAATGTQGLNLALDNKYDLLILDVMLPGIDGISLCQKLREKEINAGIIMLTARDTNKDMLTGLKSGADDYIVKPFDLELLEARMETVLKRTNANTYSNESTLGALRLSKTTQQVWRDNIEIKLTPTGFSILKILMENHPNLTSREELESRLWADQPPDSDVLRKHIYQLRCQLDKPFKDDLIVTIPKTGYRLNE